MSQDVAAPPQDPTEPEWLEDLRDDLRRVGEREPVVARGPGLLDRLLGRGQA